MGIGKLGKITRINFGQKIYIFILKIKCYLKYLFIYFRKCRLPLALLLYKDRNPTCVEQPRIRTISSPPNS